MVKPDAYSAAQELGQAITRAEDAENELRQTKIELENAHGTINRLNIQLRDLRDENAKLVAEVIGFRDAKEAQAG